MKPVFSHITPAAGRVPVSADRISLGHLALFLVLLPFDMICSELVLISLLLHTLIHLDRPGTRAIFSRQTLFLCGLFLLNIFCLLWSADKKEGVNYILRQLALFLFPVILSPMAVLVKEHRKLLLQVLGFTCVATLLYLYADALRIVLYYHLPLKTLLSRAFINHNFSAPIGLHATYLSVYVALAAVSFLQFLLEEPKRRHRLIYLLSLFVLFAGLIQLSSRAVLVSFLLVTLLVFPFFIPAGKKRILFVLVMLACSAVTMVGISRVGSLRKRYVAELKNDLTQESINNEMIESRVTRWKAIWPLALRSPVTGQGTGSEKKLLKEEYFRKKLYNSYLNELNTHNQYLKYLLESGIMGLLVFLLTLGWGIRRALGSRDLVFLSFMVLVAIVCFSENMLDVNKGIFFFGFFFSFFIIGSKPQNRILRFSDKETDNVSPFSGSDHVQ